MENEVYQIDSYGMLPERVAHKFAETYFDKPRGVAYFTNDAKFGLVDGSRVYQVKFERGDLVKTSDVYKIIAL
jgi:hypothetical protein